MVVIIHVNKLVNISVYISVNMGVNIHEGKFVTMSVNMPEALAWEYPNKSYIYMYNKNAENYILKLFFLDQKKNFREHM